MKDSKAFSFFLNFELRTSNFEHKKKGGFVESRPFFELVTLL